MTNRTMEALERFFRVKGYDTIADALELYRVEGGPVEESNFRNAVEDESVGTEE